MGVHGIIENLHAKATIAADFLCAFQRAFEPIDRDLPLRFGKL